MELVIHEYELRAGMVLALDRHPWVRLLRRLNAASGAVETAWHGCDLTTGHELTVRVQTGSRVLCVDRAVSLLACHTRTLT